MMVTHTATLAVARYIWYKRRILTSKKHTRNKSIVVLKNTAQNERYLRGIFDNKEKFYKE